MFKAQAWSARLARVKHVVTARADIVGSLLRPRELLEARLREASRFKPLEPAVWFLHLCYRQRH